MATRPKLETWEDWLVEAVIFLIAVALGSGARIAFLYKKKRIESLMDASIIFVLGLSFGSLTYMVLDYYKIPFPRLVAVWIASFMGEIIAFWADKRGFKMLDKGFEKVTGKDLTDKDNENSNSSRTP